MSHKSKKNETLDSVSALGLEPLTPKDKLGLVTLEPRLLLDAAAVVTGAELAIDVMAQDAASDASELLFSDTEAQASEDWINKYDDLNLADDAKSPLYQLPISELKDFDKALTFSASEAGNSFAVNDDGPVEIHSGETINIDVRANDIGGGTLQGIIDPAAPAELIALSPNERVTLESGLGVELLDDGTFNVTGPSNPTEPSVSFDYVVEDDAGGIHQATATFDWPEAPTIDLDPQTSPPVPGQDDFTSLTFNTDPIITNDGEVGETARYSNVGTINLSLIHI